MALSIEIRNKEVVLLDAKVTKNRMTIKNMHSFYFDEDYLDQSGISNRENFSLLLNQHLEEQQIKEKSCTICLNNSSIIYRELFIPRVDEKRIPFLVRSEMMSALNLTPDYIMDYITLEEVEKDGDILYRVLAVAVLEQAIASYIETMKLAGLKINVIDSASNAVIKMMDFADITNTSHQMVVVDVEEGLLRLYLFDEGLYVLSRNIRISELTEDNKEEVISEIIENISKMVQFTYTRNNKGINSMIYVGDDSMLEDVKNSVLETLEIEGEIFSDVLKKLSIEDFENKYVNALGVLLRK